MTVEELFHAARIVDPPALFLEAAAGLRSEENRRAFIGELTPEQIDRVRRRQAPFGVLDLLLEDLVASELQDVRNSQPQPEENQS